MAGGSATGLTAVLGVRRAVEPAQLVEHVERLYRAAWALCGSPHDAEDLVQETYLRVLARPRRLRRREELPYLLRALRNTYLTGLRAARRRPRTLALPDAESLVLRSSLAEPDVAIEHGAVLEAIAALPDPLRSALIAVDVVGLSYREAARALGVREAAITSRLFRARQRVVHAVAPGEHAA